MSFEAQNVSIYIGKKALIKNLSMSIDPGKLSVIIGPNGAGKSTTLKVLSGDLSPSEGSITLDNTPIGKINFQKLAKRRAILPQSSHVTFNFNSHDIVALGRLPYNEPASISAPIIQEIVKLTRTECLMKQQFSTLSGGEKQRVQFARVLAQIWPSGQTSEDKYLLLDEPTSALDPLYQIEILNTARWLARERGFGVLAILHDLNQAMSYADQLYILKNGELEKSGRPESVLDENTIEAVWGINAEILYRNNNTKPVIIPVMQQ
jgi:heme transport system ATP-binding protein|tara:strand:+ start:8717 stop:9508 length:792 start_codon:yes stop_codon:yes gene_type:complete